MSRSGPGGMSASVQGQQAHLAGFYGRGDAEAEILARLSAGRCWERREEAVEAASQLRAFAAFWTGRDPVTGSAKKTGGRAVPRRR